MALWKLKRRVDSPVNTQPQDVIGERLQTMDFYLTEVMPGHVVFNGYQFCMRLVESPSVPTVVEKGKMMIPGTPCFTV